MQYVTYFYKKGENEANYYMVHLMREGKNLYTTTSLSNNLQISPSDRRWFKRWVERQIEDSEEAKQEVEESTEHTLKRLLQREFRPPLSNKHRKEIQEFLALKSL